MNEIILISKLWSLNNVLDVFCPQAVDFKFEPSGPQTIFKYFLADGISLGVNALEIQK